MWISDACLCFIYLIYLELSPFLVYINYFFTKSTINSYLWAEYCLNFAGVSITFVNKNRALALYEPNGCIFLSTKEEKVIDLFTTVIDTYLTHGKALTLTPYSFVSYCLHTISKPREEDVYALFTKSSYKNVVIQYNPNKKEADTIPFYIRMAWEKQMAIQIIQTHYTVPILEWKSMKATYGSHVYYYQSEVIRPKYFNTLEEFACYVDNLLEKG